MKRWVVLGLLLVGCDDGEDPCQAVLPKFDAPADGHVEYHASTSGDARLTAIAYGTATGNVNENSPSASFSASVDVVEGDPIGITAVGVTREGGQILVGYEFTDTAGSDPVVATTSCGQ